MLHDEMWQAYEVITTPFGSPGQQRGQPTIVVVDAQGAVYVATDHKRFPSMTVPLLSNDEIAELGATFNKMALGDPGS